MSGRWQFTIGGMFIAVTVAAVALKAYNTDIFEIAVRLGRPREALLLSTNDQSTPWFVSYSILFGFGCFIYTCASLTRLVIVKTVQRLTNR
jgi:hypothetical protein